MTSFKCNTSNLFKISTLWLALSLGNHVQALTLSSPIVQSKQGEPLRVEIDLSEISQPEQVGFQANLADPNLYRALKVDLPLSNGEPLHTQIQVLRRHNGQPYLKITSTQIVDSHTVNLLIDMRWATGQLLRDLALSLDSAKQNQSTALPALTESQGIGIDTDKRIAVKQGDTASQLVIKETPENVSLDQMLVALLRRNPDAFVDSNVNRMKEGALLTLPSEKQAQATTAEEAQREISIQAKDFEIYRAELAAHAPGGTTPQLARNAEGKLEAKIQNNNAKNTPDKLTLTKPGTKDLSKEEIIAQQREAKDIADRASELSRNIADLGKLAANSASQGASGELFVDVPADPASAASKGWLNELLTNKLTPIGTAGFIAFLVLIALWRRRVNKNDENNLQDLPAVDTKLDQEQELAHSDTHNKETHFVHPKMEMPNISLDLNEPPISNVNTFEARLAQAEQLWNLGQQYTSRALVEQLANEASGTNKEKALKWLAERG